MYTGYPDEWLPCINSFKNLTHPLKIFVPGNHDFHPNVYTGPAFQDLRKRGVIMVGTHPDHYTYELPNGMILLGLPFVTGLPGWAFNRTEEELSSLVRSLPKADIVVSHSPPQGIGDGENWGVRAWRLYQIMHKPKIWINGHIHECYGEYAVNGTEFHNVAMCDRRYVQVNKAHVIDV